LRFRAGTGASGVIGMRELELALTARHVDDEAFGEYPVTDDAELIVPAAHETLAVDLQIA
jgi:hypothetical protein